jgi:hypothetical protein
VDAAVPSRSVARRPVDDDGAACAGAVRLRRMTIEVPPEQLHALADALRAQAEEADEVAARLAGAPVVPGPLAGPVSAFLEAHRTAGTAVAGELRWLGGAIAAAADSWLGLDGSLVPRRDRAVPR